jgi:acetyl-CoA acetyltransferase
LKDPLTMTDYLAARPIAEPLHLFDCVMPCAGAEAFLVMSQEKARALAVDHVRILALEELHHAFSLDPIQLRGGWELFRKRLYDAAGVSPYDIGLVETYDDYPVMSVIQIEDLGFCDKGDGWRWLAQRQLTCAGDFPHNSSGGQLSCGQAGAAGGFLGLVEAIRQLTGAALGNQCLNVVHALVSGYGMVNYDRGLCSAAVIISRADS